MHLWLSVLYGDAVEHVTIPGYIWILLGIYCACVIPCLILLLVAVVHSCRGTWPDHVGSGKFTLWVVAVFFWPLTLVLYILFSVVYRMLLCCCDPPDDESEQDVEEGKMPVDDGGFGTAGTRLANGHVRNTNKGKTITSGDQYEVLTPRGGYLQDRQPVMKLITDRDATFSRCAVCLESLSDTYGYVKAEVLTEVCTKVRDRDKNNDGDMMAYYVQSKSRTNDWMHETQCVDINLDDDGTLIFTSMATPTAPDMTLDEDDICVTPCGHCFHHKCLVESLKTQPKCPECRSDCGLYRCYVIYGDTTKEHIPFRISEMIYYIKRLKSTCFTTDSSSSISTASDHYYMTPVELDILSSHISSRIETDDDIILFRPSGLESGQSNGGPETEVRGISNSEFLGDIDPDAVVRQLDYGTESPHVVVWESPGRDGDADDDDTFV